MSKFYVCLRDDDTSVITTPEDLKNAYDVYWGKLPVTLATVAFSHGSQNLILKVENEPNKYKAVYDWEKSASAEELTAYHRIHPIGENQELVEYLKPLIRAGKVEIAQHGVNHRYNERGPEMLKDQHSIYTIRAAKEYLEKVFETQVCTFIPPSNTVDRQIVHRLSELGLHLFSSGSITAHGKMDRIVNICSDRRGLMETIIQVLTGKAKPIRKRCGTYMFGSPTFDIWRTTDEMYGRVMNNLESSGFSGLGTHYMIAKHLDYKRKYLDLLDRLVQLTDIEFVTAKQYYKLLMEKYYG